MTNTEDNYDNFYDTELIVEFLRGLLPSDLHLKIQQQIETSEVFRTYVEGVQINFEQSGKNLEKMQADIAKKKARTWSNLQQQQKPESTLNEKLSYTFEQLKSFFLPNPQLELALQPTRAASTSTTQISVNDTAETLTLVLAPKNTQVIDLELFDNKIQSIQKHEIPANSEDFTLSVASWRPGIYYAKLKSNNADAYMMYFYIREDLKPDS